VTEFDEYIGLGVIEAENGEKFPFHCTQIADGSRVIAVGTSVVFVVKARPKGPEAYEVTKV
jgi:CspA family cold shock protein